VNVYNLLAKESLWKTNWVPFEKISSPVERRGDILSLTFLPWTQQWENMIPGFFMSRRKTKAAEVPPAGSLTS
jgi:hypothetical protein